MIGTQIAMEVTESRKWVREDVKTFMKKMTVESEDE